MIEGVTALELALSEFTTRRFAGDAELLNRLGAFHNLNLPAKLVAAGAFSGEVSQADLAAAVDAVLHRNDVAHRG